MKERARQPGQSPERRAAGLKRRHVEARDRRTSRRRTRLAVAVTAIVLAVVAGVVVARAFGHGGAGRGPSATTASAFTRPAASSSAASASEATPAPQTTPEPVPTPKPRFLVKRALHDVRALEDIGVRSAGGGAERRGAAYISKRLVAAGAKPETRTFRLPNGKTSRNVVARFPGSTRRTMILGAHMDSKAPSPGANDNGSGCGALLEIARCLGRRHAYPTVQLVFFGAEEMIDANPNHHHFGSRHHVKHMSAGARKNAAGMISVDMIGYGPHFVVRTMGRGPQSLRRLLLRQARERGIRLSYLADPGPSGWSDHEAFELAGIPAAWLEWRDDPRYHTTADTSGHLVAAKVRTAGKFVLDVLYGMDAAALGRLAR